MNKLRLIQRAKALLLAAAISTPASALRAQMLPGPTNTTFLGSWSFSDTNAWTSDQGYAPVSFTHLGVSYFGQYTAAVVDSTNAAWLRYNVVETNGVTNLTVDTGTLMGWFAPANWSSTNAGGTGPGEWGRLLEVGSYSTNDDYGWWCLYVDPAGANIYFSAQTNGSDAATILSAPIDWATNRWHHIALTYSSTNTALYLDGTNAANGPGLTCWPGPDALANGFGIGSDTNGLSQAHGMFDQLYAYRSVVSANAISNAFSFSGFWYYANPLNSANFSSGANLEQITPLSALSGSPVASTFSAVSGLGYLIPVSTNTGVSSSNVWLTNVTAKVGTNGGMSVTFTIAGGTNGAYYDVFANVLVGPTNNAAYNWAWMGQGPHFMAYTLSNLPNVSTYLILGTPQDSDSDGLTDAYERLVSHTDPNKADSVGDGILDGWRVYLGLNPLVSTAAQSGQESDFTYNGVGWLQGVSGIRGETITPDAEGNITRDSK